MNNLYEALESCLHDIENGADVEAVLLRYSDIADELRPIVQASVNAKSLAAPDPSVDVMQRNRARLLQRASEMRASKAGSLPRFPWLRGRNKTSGVVQLRRLAVTLIVLAALFASGTGLVRAASTTLPGDNLYPVKRTWEDVLLLFTLNGQQREALEVEHENKRLEELNELFAKGRTAEVDFAGLVMLQNGNEWRVAGFPVVISSETEMPDQPVAVGAAVRVRGITRGDGIVLAERIQLLSSDASLPDVQDEPENENESNEGPNQPTEDNSGPGSGDDRPQVKETETPEIESENSGSNSGSNNSGSDDNSNNSGSNDSNSNDDHSGSDNSNEDNS